MLTHDLDVRAGAEYVRRRAEQFSTNRHREKSACEEEEQNAHDVLQSDDLVVKGVAEVLRPTFDRGLVVRFLAHQFSERVIKGPDAEQPAHHCENKCECVGRGVLPTVGDVGIATRDVVPKPVAECVAQHRSDDGRTHVLA